jgi:hypothetical protein
MKGVRGGEGLQVRFSMSSSGEGGQRSSVVGVLEVSAGYGVADEARLVKAKTMACLGTSIVSSSEGEARLELACASGASGRGRSRRSAAQLSRQRPSGEALEQGE